MSNNSSLKTILSAALVAGVVTASGIGLFVANQPKQPTAPAAPVATAPAEKPSAGADFSDEQKKSIETLVRTYLLENPEVLIEMSTELDRRQTVAEQEARIKAISENSDALFRSADALVVGNPDGDVTLVEFSDYNCPYCKRSLDAITKLIENDPNVRIVMKEYPVLSQGSIDASRVAIAAAKQGKYFEVHSALLRHRGRINTATALRIAERVGLDVEKLKADMELPETAAVIDKTRQLGEKLGVQGTPFFLVGDQAVPGAPENLYDIFVEMVAKIRKEGCTATC